MTKEEIEALINSNLESESSITAEKHREVEIALLNFANEAALNLPLAKGTRVIGDVNPNDMLVNVFFATPLAVSDYIVAGSLVGLSADFNNDNDVIWSVREKNAFGFKLALRELAGVQNINFDYVIFRK